LATRVTFKSGSNKLVGKTFEFSPDDMHQWFPMLENLLASAGYQKHLLSYRWNPNNDRVNIAFVNNGISSTPIAEFVIDHTDNGARLNEPTKEN